MLVFFVAALGVIRLINNAVNKLCAAAVIVHTVCFMPCVAVADGSCGTQLARNDKE